MRTAFALLTLTLSCSAEMITFTKPMNLEQQRYVMEHCSHPEFCSDLLRGPGDAIPGGYEAHITLPTVTFDPVILPPGSTITNVWLSYFAQGGTPNIENRWSATGPLCDEPCDWSEGGGGTINEYYDTSSVGNVNGEHLIGGYSDGFGIGPYFDSFPYYDGAPWTKLAAMVQEGKPLVINNELWTAFSILRDGGGGPYNNWEYQRVEWSVQLEGEWYLDVYYDAPPVAPVPEPGSLTAVAAGLLAAIGISRKRL